MLPSDVTTQIRWYRKAVYFLSFFSTKKNYSSVSYSTLSMPSGLPPEGSTRAQILPRCPSVNRSRDVEIGFEPRTFLSVNWRTNH
ncbi:hypothetical protein T265_10910 [Opisthorchis viverrini]|uniref:Uncharacterized protein n=1 Tax=Opisthorchis viverrini TaxID=6198 RepID=A0A074Z0J3_OPIVI|nr:hypothetical protein T265_10910 [Opisthorchis viverrini]KER20561.1 hypothetical protein T265_10910 [Opisthorchis viverrini]